MTTDRAIISRDLRRRLPLADEPTIAALVGYIHDHGLYEKVGFVKSSAPTLRYHDALAEAAPRLFPVPVVDEHATPAEKVRVAGLVEMWIEQRVDLGRLARALAPPTAPPTLSRADARDIASGRREADDATRLAAAAVLASEAAEIVTSSRAAYNAGAQISPFAARAAAEEHARAYREAEDLRQQDIADREYTARTAEHAARGAAEQAAQRAAIRERYAAERAAEKAHLDEIEARLAALQGAQ